MDNQFAEIRKKALPLLKPYITYMAVFGSTVRGEATPKSDLDLLIRLKPPNTRPKLGLFKLMEIEENLNKELGCEVDLVTEESLSPYIRPYVEKEKVVIYEEG
ncbi:MAG: nucleotidyltransferase family protein [Chloroflexi bacterium]|nr:nucleotidyltransferase family protein [Chloroflexota bacterium]